MTDSTKPKTRNRKPGTPPFLKDARKERPGEKIGGGFFVFRRTSRTGRIRAPEWPFEHPTLAAAQAERDRLAGVYPGEKFVIVQEFNDDMLEALEAIYRGDDSPDRMVGDIAHAAIAKAKGRAA